jgi:hypothetical protein
MMFQNTSAHEGISVAAMLLLAAFAIDRLASGITFLVFRPRGKQSPEEQESTNWNKKLTYYLVSSAIVIPLLAVMTQIRLLSTMGMISDKGSSTAGLVDAALTFLVLVGGGEKISSFLGTGGGGGKSEEPKPVELTLTVAKEGEGKSEAATRH